MKRLTCGDCLHFEPDAGPRAAESMQRGECRINPPFIGIEENSFAAVWPKVPAAAYCGQLQQRPPDDEEPF